jgi:D-alanine-D-alanine ligase
MKNIAIVCGGNSGEYEISIGSGKMVFDHLDKSRFNGYIIVIRNKDWYFEDESGDRFDIDKSSFTLELKGDIVLFDGVFNAIHGTPGEDGKLQAYFELMGLPYTSCNVATSALTFNKYHCNRFVNSYGITTANSFSYAYGEKINAEDVIKKLGLPLFVKPAESGSSVGITKVNMEDEFDEAIAYAFSESDRILIEEYIKGREITCGLFNRGNELIVLPLTEIVSKKDFFDYEAKYTHGAADEITPADLAEDVEQDIKTISSFLFRKMDCKGFVRFDYIITEDELYFLEVNSVPGITEASILPKMIKEFGMDIKTFFSIILDNLFEKS